MADFLTPAMRSRLMATIRSKDTKPEMLVRSALHQVGFRFRLHDAKLPGRPDLVLKRFRVAIFVNGCFWHGHSCRLYQLPASNSEYWGAKIAKNRARDKSNQRALRRDGWRVIVVRECQLANRVHQKRTLVRLVSKVCKGTSSRNKNRYLSRMSGLFGQH